MTDEAMRTGDEGAPGAPGAGVLVRSAGPTRGTIVRLVLAIVAMVAAFAGAGALKRYAVDTPRGQQIDELGLATASGITGGIHSVIYSALDTVTLPVALGILAVGVVIALVRRRPGLLVHMLVLVGGANITTQLAKSIGGREALATGIQETPNSFPSGHTTLAASVVLAVVLVCPARVRSLVGMIGALWAAAAGLGTIHEGWHRPSDVLGAVLVAGGWAFAVLAADAIAEWMRTPQPGPVHHSGLLGGIVLLATGIPAALVGVHVATTLPDVIDLASAELGRQVLLLSDLLILGGELLMVASVLWIRTPERRIG